MDIGSVFFKTHLLKDYYGFKYHKDIINLLKHERLRK